MSTRMSAAASVLSVNRGGGIGHSATGLPTGPAAVDRRADRLEPEPLEVPYLVGEWAPPAHSLDLRRLEDARVLHLVAGNVPRALTRVERNRPPAADEAGAVNDLREVDFVVPPV